MNQYHQANQLKWNARASAWQAARDQTGVWKKAHKDPGISFLPTELEAIGHVEGKRVCVLASGDNLAAFSLAGMGAQVTSVDISQNQLDVARERALHCGLDITFICSDATSVKALNDSTFDLVYTGGGVCVWISDINVFFSEGARLLKRNGRFVINDKHPFGNIWQATQSGDLEQEFGYFNRGPYVYDATQKSPELPSNSKQYEFHWTISDRVMALLHAGFELLSIHEYEKEGVDGQHTPALSLPEDLLLIARKRSEC